MGDTVCLLLPPDRDRPSPNALGRSPSHARVDSAPGHTRVQGASGSRRHSHREFGGRRRGDAHRDAGRPCPLPRPQDAAYRSDGGTLPGRSWGVSDGRKGSGAVPDRRSCRISSRHSLRDPIRRADGRCLCHRPANPTHRRDPGSKRCGPHDAGNSLPLPNHGQSGHATRHASRALGYDSRPGGAPDDRHAAVRRGPGRAHSVPHDGEQGRSQHG